jgi:hypothetical protein
MGEIDLDKLFQQ